MSKEPAVGEPFCVLYDQENPRRNGLYPLPFVRLALGRRFTRSLNTP